MIHDDGVQGAVACLLFSNNMVLASNRRRRVAAVDTYGD
jgi:hypothetical protein